MWNYVVKSITYGDEIKLNKVTEEANLTFDSIIVLMGEEVLFSGTIFCNPKWNDKVLDVKLENLNEKYNDKLIYHFICHALINAGLFFGLLENFQEFISNNKTKEPLPSFQITNQYIQDNVIQVHFQTPENELDGVILYVKNEEGTWNFHLLYSEKTYFGFTDDFRIIMEEEIKMLLLMMT